MSIRNKGERMEVTAVVTDGDEAERFGGIGRLYGRDGLERIKRSRVMVVGIGGVGSWVAEALARSGVGSMRLVDLDDICVTNVNRQVHALSGTVGRPKVTVMAERLRDISPGIEIDPVLKFYNERTAEEVLTPPVDVVVDAIDSVRQKAHLLAGARAHGYAVVSVGGAGGRVDPTRIRIDDLCQTGGDRLLLQLRRELRKAHGFPEHGKGHFGIPCVYSNEPVKYPWSDGRISCAREPGTPAGLHCDAGFGSATHITATMGFFAAGEVLRLLTAVPTP